MKRALTYWLLFVGMGCITSQALASGGGGHGGGGHGSSGGHAGGGFHGSLGHSSSTWGGLHATPGYHGFSSRPSGHFTVGDLGTSRTATSPGNGLYTADYYTSSKGASAAGSSNSKEKVTIAEALGPLRELDPGPAPVVSQQLPDTVPANKFTPVLEPEFTPITPPLSSAPINNEEFWRTCLGGLCLIGVGGYLRYRHWTRQSQLLAPSVADMPVYPSAKAALATEEPLVAEAKADSRILKVYKKSPARISKK